MNFQTFLNCSNVYKQENINEIIDNVFKNVDVVGQSNTKIKYYNVACSFDIETTSFYSGSEKRACMYMWSMCLNGACIVGRTWQQFTSCIDSLAAALHLNIQNRLIIGVHNLAYEFQFMRKWFKWSKVFALDKRKPVYALTENGVEFRCTYMLSGYSLANLGKQLRKYPVQKLVGDLDYSLMRHSGTFLTGKEIAYSINDVKVVAAYLQEQIEAEGKITDIPITKTGYVRRYCRNSCFYTKGIPRKKSFKRLRYMDLMSGMTLTPEVYQQLKRAFQGGFTHANAYYSGQVLKDVASFDFTSSYPAVMIAEQFPMSAPEDYTPKNKADFLHCLKCYCCIFDVRFTGLKPKLYHENYISMSRCWGVENYVLNNGRVVSADVLYTTITEQDYYIINQYYSYDHIAVSNFRRFRKGYLPTDFVKSILKLYVDKTALKDVEGRETDYMLSKGMLNSCYGMAVTDIVRDNITYAEEWESEKPSMQAEIEKYNRSSSRFLYYPWGVYVTAYARRNLFTGITECGQDYVYSDTDSVKILNAEAHAEYFKRYNDLIIKKLKKAMDFHKIPYDQIAPKTIKGVEKPLGVWDQEEGYQRFKTLGAKRYMVEQRGEINITVSGLNKRVTVPYLTRGGNEAAFARFSADLYVPKEYTGKNTHTYIDSEISGDFADYLGFYGSYYEKSFVHLEPADYSLGLAQEYIDYILMIKECEEV